LVELEEYVEDAIMLSVLLGSMGALMACTTFIPEPTGKYVGMSLYFALVFTGMFIPPMYAQVTASKYPYLQVVVRPINVVLHVFVDKDKSLDRPLSGNEDIYEAHIKTAYPVKFEDYGRVKELVILHKRKLGDRIYFRPGKAVFHGIRIDHPQTEIIEVLQTQGASTFIDYGEPIPVFHLLMGSKDRQYASAMAVSANPGNLEAELNMLRMQISELQVENAKLRRDAVELHQRSVADREVIVQQRAETSGLLDVKTGVKEHALEFVLGLYQSLARFDKLVEVLGGKRFGLTFNKWIALSIIAVAFIAYLWANPQAAAAIQLWLMSPWNFLLVVIALVAILAIILYSGKRKRGG
jgi:hypothetical protein